jgi:hypothetical protein
VVGDGVKYLASGMHACFALAWLVREIDLPSKNIVVRKLLQIIDIPKGAGPV